MCTVWLHRKTSVVVWVCCMIGAVTVFDVSAAYAGNGTTPQPPSPTIPRPPANPIPPPSSPVPNPPNRAPDPSQRPQLGRDAADARNAADTNENQQEKDNRGKDDNESLSKKLDENEGVIEPPRDGDSEIVEPAPDTDAKIKVIPPPGEPGGDPNIQPK